MAFAFRRLLKHSSACHTIGMRLHIARPRDW